MSIELKQKLQDLKGRLLTLRRAIFEVDEKKERIAELEQQTLKPGFWGNQETATAVQKEQGRLQGVVEHWENCWKEWEEAELLLSLALEEKDSDAENEVATLLDRLDKDVDASELLCMFTGEHDANNAMLSINAGAGGTEAQDWVSMLLRMYLRWAEESGFKTEILDQLPGDEAGIKSVTVMISGNYAYGYLRSEMGIHRMVRISPFDASGRRHTSFASVFIFPELDDDIVVDINEKDLRIDTYRASGAGGQHVNKTSSAIRITHLPSGIVVQCQNERSQHRNKDTAMKMLKARLYERGKELQKEDQQELHGDKKEIAWGSQIRSYVMQPYRLVKDHRTNCEMGNVDSVMDGNLDPFIKSFLLWQR
ncbi:MAG: peptide chain release factor 2 [Proteobacteria bacterium]|nr:peptide chain release factor 2 [Pseudomonadota bacterium]MBU1739593.1 peptide chain release factor 2 [Pseudomonadota bacterium]